MVLRFAPPRHLAMLLMRSLTGPGDQRASVDDLAQRCGIARRTLQLRCADAGTTAGTCVDFVFCAQLVLRRERHWQPAADLLRFRRDPRTVERLLDESGLRPQSRPTLRAFLRRQRFVDGALLDELQRLLSDR